MEAVKLKLLAPACCPNCGHDLRPDNPILPQPQGTPDPAASTIEGLFNYVKPAEPPRAPRWPRSKTPPVERRPPYGLRSPVNKAAWRRTRRAGRERSRAWKLQLEAKAVPPINPVQKRLLEIASEDVGDVKIEPPVLVSTRRFAADDRRSSEPTLPGVDDAPRPNPAMPYIKGNAISQSDVDNFLENFFDDNDTRKVASPKRLKPPIPENAPRPIKLPWKGYRVCQPDNFVRQTGDPPAYDSVGGEVVSLQVPTESGRVVAIHNHFYGETVVIPDTP